MKTEILSIDHPDALPRALAALAASGLLVFPTDTVYGLGCLVSDARGIERIYTAKGRDTAKAIPILLGDFAHLAGLVPALPSAARRLAERFWPGALTLVALKSPHLPAALSTLPTVGVRMPDHPFALALLRQAGPLAVTSANRSGGANPLTAQDVLAQLDGRVELLLDGGPVSGGVPSTVVDCTTDPVSILRQGALSATDIRLALQPD